MNGAGIIQQIPDLAPILNLKKQADSALRQVFDRLGEPPENFMAGLLDPLDRVRGFFPTAPAEFNQAIRDLPGAVTKFIPENLDDLVAPLKDGFGGILDLVAEGPFKDLLPQIESGKTLEELADGALNAAKSEIIGKITETAGAFFSSARFQPIQDFLETLDELKTNLPASPDQLVEFLGDGFLGVPESLLQEAKTVSRNFFQGFDANLAVLLNLNGFKVNLTDFLSQATARLRAFDANNSAHYDEAIDLLAQAESKLNEITLALSLLPAQITATLDGINLDQFRQALQNAIRNIPPITVLGVGEIARLIGDPLEALDRELQAADPAVIRSRLKTALNDLLSAFDVLAGLVQENPISKFFAGIRERIESLDVADLKNRIEGFFDDVNAVIGEVDVEALKQQFTQALQKVEQVLAAIDLAAVSNEIVSGFNALRDAIQGLPLQAIHDGLDQALDTLDGLVETLETGSEAAVAPLQTVQSGLDGLSFHDKAQPAIEAMQKVQEVLEGIDLSVLPSSVRQPAEKAVQQFKAAIGGNDPARFFREDVVEFLIDLFEAAEKPLRQLSDAIEAGLDKFLNAMDDFDPGGLLNPLIEPFNKLKQTVAGLDAATFIQPVENVVQQMLDEMQKVSPAEVFGVLEAEFDAFVAKLDGFSPGALLTPLQEIYDRMQALLQKLNLMPLLQKTPDLGKTLLGETKSNLTGLFDTSPLPVATTDLAGKIGPLLDLANPELALEDFIPKLQSSLGTLKPGDIFVPLQGIFDSFVDLIGQIADEVLVPAFQAVQDRVNHLDRIDPARLPGVWDQTFNGLSLGVNTNGPAGLITALTPAHNDLAAAFSQIDAAAVPAALQDKYNQIQAKLTALNPATALTPMVPAFTELANRINSAHQPLDLGELVKLFQPVRDKLEVLIPDFLKADLTAATIRQGLQAISPETLRQAVNAKYDALLATAARFVDILRDEATEFIDKLGERVEHLSLFGILETYQAIFDAVSNALAILNPANVAAELEAIYQALIDKINALHPRFIKESLQAVFDGIVAKINAIDLQAIKNAINEALAAIKAALDVFDPEALREALKTRLETIKTALAELPIAPALEAFANTLTRLKNDLEQTLKEAASTFNAMAAALPA